MELTRDDVEIMKINHVTRKFLICGRCETEYYPIRNVGKWRCMQHRSKIITEEGRHLCCNKLALPKTARSGMGCVAADHYTGLHARMHIYDESSDVIMHSELVSQLEPLKNSVVISHMDGLSMRISVRRYASTE